MAAEKVVVLDCGKCQAINPFPEMDTDEHEQENMQNNSAINRPTSTVLVEQEDLSNDMPRYLVTEATRRSSLRTATSVTNHEVHHTQALPGTKCCLSEKIRSICKCWTELEGLPSDENLQRYIHALFCNTLRLTLSKEWCNATSLDCENLRNALFHVNSRVCQALAALLPSPWGGETILKVIHGSFVPSVSDAAYDTSKKEHLKASAHVCTEACLREPRNVARTRVELLCFAGLKHEALRLCLYYHNCPVLSEDSFYGCTAFHLLYVSGSIKHLIDEVDNLTCHDGFHLIQLILREHNTVHPLAECLMQIMLVRDLVESSPYCCTLALMEMWCSLHVKQGTSLKDVEQEVLKLGSLATKSAHLYLLVDVLYKQYGRCLLPLYLNLYVHALTIDFNNLEYARQVDCRVAVAELETHMSAIYTKLASLLASEEDQGLARECELTAFSLEPTIERLTKLRTYASAYPVKWSYHHVVRLVPCSGECHCSEKGLCRRDPAVPPWFMTHVPSGILDSNLMGVSKQLLQDLCILVEGPRCRWLTWNMPWKNLHEICMHYLTTAREFRACTDDRRVGIEARLKRLGPFDCSTIPVYRKGNDSSMDFQDCILDQNERKSATENCNEIGTSTVQDEIQINVSGTSEMKSEASEIKKTVLHNNNDTPEICGSRVPWANNAVCNTDLMPDKKHTERVHVSASFKQEILAPLDSCHSGYTVDKIELTLPPGTVQQKLQLQVNGDRRDAQMMQMTHNKQHNGSSLVKEPVVQTPAYLNTIKGCNALSESGTSLLSVQCGQHELSPSSMPHALNCNSPTVSPSTNATFKSLHCRQFNEEFFMGTIPESLNPFENDALPITAHTVNSVNLELNSAPQSSIEAASAKQMCMESLRSLLNPNSLQSPNAPLSVEQPPLVDRLSSVMPSTRECLVAETLDDRIKDSTNEPKKGALHQSINLESLIAETLLYSPRSSYETLLTCETPPSASEHVLHPSPIPSVASSSAHTEYTNVTTTTTGGLSVPVMHQCSASLMDHLYGKNMLQPIFVEHAPVTNPTVSMVMQETSALSSTPIYTTTLSGVSQNNSTATPSPAKSHNGIGNAKMTKQPNGMNSHEVNINQQPGNINIGSQNVTSCPETRVMVSKTDFVFPTEVNHNYQSIGDFSQVVSECMMPAGTNTHTPILHASVQQYVNAAQTQGISRTNLLGISALGSVAPQSNSVQAKPKINSGRPEHMDQVVLQLQPRTSSTLLQQPGQTYIMQPKLNHNRKTLQLTPLDLMPVYHVTKAATTNLNACSVRPLEGQQTQLAQNMVLEKPCAPNLLQPINQSLSQSSTVVTLPVARVQCPPTRTLQQSGMLLHSSRPQVSCNSKPANPAIGTLQRQTPGVNLPRGLETPPSKSSQNATMPKQSGSCLQKNASQSLSQTSGSGTSVPRASYTPLHSSGTMSSQQESNSLTLPLKSKLQMFVTPSRLQTRRPFNKPKTDGKPRWTTSYSPHGKMVHHKNGQEKDASVLRTTENANVSKLNLTAKVASTSSTMSNPIAGVQRTLVKMGNAAVSCTSLTKPTSSSSLLNSLCRSACATSSSVEVGVSATNFSEINAVPVAVLVSPEVANSLCARVMSTGIERTTIRPPNIANSTGVSKVSVAMVMPPEMTSGAGISRASSSENRAVISTPALTTDASSSTVSTVQAPSNTESSSTSAGPAMINYKAVEAPCVASNSSIIKTQIPNYKSSITGAKTSPMIANFQSKMNSNVDPGLGQTQPSSVQSKFCTGAAPVAPTIVLSGKVGQSSSIGSTTTATTAITSRPPNAATYTSGSLLSAALSSQPTVVLNKLGLQNRNIPVVKKCISPAILNRTLNRAIPVPGKMSSDSQFLSQSQRCSLGQSSTQEVSRRKDLAPIRLLPKDNTSLHSSDVYTSANVKYRPKVNALLSLTKSQLEVGLQKWEFKQNSPSISSPSKQVTDSKSKTSEPQGHLLAKLHDEPQKCVCPICNKVLLRKSLRAHVTKIHKDVRNIEFAENRGTSKSQPQLPNIASSNAKDCSLENCSSYVHECTPALMMEVSDTAECSTDSQMKNTWLKYDQVMPNLNSRSVSETSIREPSTDSKSTTDEKSTDETSSDTQARFLHDVSSSPKSLSDVMDEKEGSPKKEDSMTATSSETGESYATRGRVSSRNIKPPQKRSCPCCENTSPNSSAKKCRDEKLTKSAPRKSMHAKMHRKTRSSGRNDKSH